MKQNFVKKFSTREIVAGPLSLPKARRAAWNAALADVGESYIVMLWDGDTMERTHHAYRAQCALNAEVGALIGRFDENLLQ